MESLAVLRTASMTSKEIADLVGSRHDKVKQSIERLTERGAIFQPPVGDVPFVDEAGRQRTVEAYVFSGEQGKRDSIVVVAQLSPEFTARLVDRWMELEKGVMPQTVPVPLIPAQVGRITVDCMMEVALKWGVPMHYALQVSAEEATRQTGMPWDRMLTQAAAMNGVPKEEVLLEPTELGALFDLSAVAMNRKLAELGLQERVGGKWVPTEAGDAVSIRHAWVRGNKSGYNLKWRVREIERMMASTE